MSLRRRLVLLAAGLGLVPVRAQNAARPARIGFVASVPIKSWPPFAIFTEGMRELGWVEGRHYVIDEASYDGRAERIPAVVAELVSRQPDLIVGSATAPMRALIRATKTIPIVMFAVGDPEGQGFVSNLARPGGNVTGLSSLDHGILAKQFELLLQAAPQVRRVGAVFNPDIPPHVKGLAEVEGVASRVGVQARPIAMRSPGELEATMQALQRERVEAVHFFSQPYLNTGNQTERLAAFALQQRWPTVMNDRPHVAAGMLLAYGWKIDDLLRRLPHYVDRILKGTPPGEMPVEQPTRYYLTINLKTARTLGLKLPQSLLLQATEVIE
jgi:putative tryptophan/tyrosine transport system substrate-binding protein